MLSFKKLISKQDFLDKFVNLFPSYQDLNDVPTLKIKVDTNQFEVVAPKVDKFTLVHIFDHTGAVSRGLANYIPVFCPADINLQKTIDGTRVRYQFNIFLDKNANATSAYVGFISSGSMTANSISELYQAGDIDQEVYNLYSSYDVSSDFYILRIHVFLGSRTGGDNVVINQTASGGTRTINVPFLCEPILTNGEASPIAVGSNGFACPNALDISDASISNNPIAAWYNDVSNRQYSYITSPYADLEEFGETGDNHPSYTFFAGEEDPCQSLADFYTQVESGSGGGSDPDPDPTPEPGVDEYVTMAQVRQMIESYAFSNAGDYITI